MRPGSGQTSATVIEGQNLSPEFAAPRATTWWPKPHRPCYLADNSGVRSVQVRTFSAGANIWPLPGLPRPGRGARTPKRPDPCGPGRWCTPPGTHDVEGRRTRRLECSVIGAISSRCSRSSRVPRTGPRRRGCATSPVRGRAPCPDPGRPRSCRHGPAMRSSDPSPRSSPLAATIMPTSTSATDLSVSPPTVNSVELSTWTVTLDPVGLGQRDAVAVDGRGLADDRRQHDGDRRDRVVPGVVDGLPEADLVADLEIGQGDLLALLEDRRLVGDGDRARPAVDRLERDRRAVDRADRDVSGSEPAVAPGDAGEPVAEAEPAQQRPEQRVRRRSCRPAVPWFRGSVPSKAPARQPSRWRLRRRGRASRRPASLPASGVLAVGGPGAVTRLPGPFRRWSRRGPPCCDARSVAVVRPRVPRSSRRFLRAS